MGPAGAHRLLRGRGADYATDTGDAVLLLAFPAVGLSTSLFTFLSVVTTCEIVIPDYFFMLCCVLYFS